MKPMNVTQYQKAGRGFLITRNSATLADTDYENIAKEIVDALNKRHAYEKLVEEVRTLASKYEKLWAEHCERVGYASHFMPIPVAEARALLRELGENKE